MQVSNIPRGQAIAVEIECYGTPRTTDPDTKVGYDGSLSAGGVEVQIVGQRTDRLELPDVSSIVGCTVDLRCGLHVHVDVRDLTFEQAEAVYLRLVRLQRHLKMLCPESRQQNRYCRWRRNNTSGYRRNSRYAAINFQAYYKYRTIEFRCQSGSADPEKITKWADLCWQLVQWARGEGRALSLIHI
jgi:hypothetical protein